MEGLRDREKAVYDGFHIAELVRYWYIEVELETVRLSLNIEKK